MTQQNNNSSPVLASTMPQINDFSIVLVVEDKEEENGTLEAQITRVKYFYALELLQPIADWLEVSGRHWRVGDRRCWSVEEVVQVLVEGGR